MITQAITITRRNGRKITHETISIPSDDILIAASLELRQLGGDTKPAAGQYGNCLGIYIPPREYDVSEIDPFTGNRGEVRKDGTIPATCAFWVGPDIRVAEARYERDPIDIYYYCEKTNGIQRGLFHKDEQQGITEGAIRVVEQSEYERNPRLRELALEHHGHSCAICGFSFEEAYGECARGFIHVHHLTPLSKVGAAHTVDPKTDLVPVCPNCHAVIHLKNPPYTPGEVQEMIKKKC